MKKNLIKNLPDLFSTPISQTKVRDGIMAYQYRNGIINIAGQRYSGYSMKDAIKLWRKNNPIK